MLNCSFYVQDIPAADEVLILSLFQGSCLIVSEREVIRGVESWSFENKHLLCAH